MSFSFTVNGHVADDAAVPGLNNTIKEAADTFVQTLRDAGVPMSTASLSLPAGGGDAGSYTDYMAEQPANEADPSAAAGSGEAQPTGAE